MDTGAAIATAPAIARKQNPLAIVAASIKIRRFNPRLYPPCNAMYATTTHIVPEFA